MNTDLTKMLKYEIKSLCYLRNKFKFFTTQCIFSQQTFKVIVYVYLTNSFCKVAICYYVLIKSLQQWKSM